MRSVFAHFALVAALAPGLAVAADPQQCWQARETPGTPRFVPVTVGVTDQFESVSTRLARPRSICNPTSVNGAFLDDPTAHLTCYDSRDDRSGVGRFQKVRAEITNLLGTQVIAVLKPHQLCVPTEKGIDPAPPVPSALDLDHFRCYKAKPVKGSPSPVVPLTLDDQFADRTATTKTAFRFCAPVSVDGSPIDDPALHLTCYRFTDTTGVPLTANIPVNIANDLGTLALTARTRAARYLCLPSTKVILPDD